MVAFFQHLLFFAFDLLMGLMVKIQMQFGLFLVTTREESSSFTFHCSNNIASHLILNLTSISRNNWAPYQCHFRAHENIVWPLLFLIVTVKFYAAFLYEIQSKKVALNNGKRAQKWYKRGKLKMDENVHWKSKERDTE